MAQLNDGAKAPRILVNVGPHADDAIGENFMKLPLLRALRRTWPRATIDWMHGEGPWMLAENGPLSDFGAGLIDGFRPASLVGAGLAGAILPNRRVFGGRYDLIVDCQRNVATTLALRRIPHHRFISATWNFALSDAKPPESAPGWRRASLAERLLILHAAAAGNWSAPDPAAPLPKRYHDAAERILPGDRAYVGFAPGAGNMVRGKCWPLDRFITAAKAQREAGRTPVFILGPAERRLGKTVADALPDALIPPLETAQTGGVPGDAPGGTALTVALAGRMVAAVANCSGTGHMLAAGGAPMVSLYGPTDPFKFRPYARSITAVRAQDFGGEAMEAIPVDAVTGAIEDALVER